MKTKRISINNEERIALQTLITTEIRKNPEYEKIGIEPCFKTEELKKLYRKIAGYEYNE